MLEGIDITKSYENKKKNVVLKKVSAGVKPGEITALIGPSGSGKSTFLRMLSLLEHPDEGVISLDDQNYEFPLVNGKQDHRFPWPLLTIVFQQLFLWPHLTIRKNIMLPLQNVNGAGKNEQVEELINYFELEDFVDRFPNEASLGQRQRAAIVRALALNPKYLLLDEVTSALDVEHVGKLLQRLKLLKSQGTAIMLVTHLIGFARQSADQVVFMEDGEITEYGGPQLLTSPKSERVAKFLSLIHSAN